MKSPNTKSSNELKQDVQNELRKVNRDIDHIQGRLSPGKIIDDVIFKSHSRNPLAIFDHLKRNPVGTTFLSLGTLLLSEDATNSSYEELARGKVKEGITSVKSNIASFRESDGSSSHRFEEARDSFQAKVNEIRNGLSSKIPDPDKVSNKIQQSEFKLASKIEAGRNTLRSFDPLVFLALGAGLGIVTGAALPVSVTEKKMISDKFQSKLSDFNKDLKDALNECSNTLKELVLLDIKDRELNIF